MLSLFERSKDGEADCNGLVGANGAAIADVVLNLLAHRCRRSAIDASLSREKASFL